MNKKIDYESLPKRIQLWDFLDIIEVKCTAHELNPYHIVALVETESAGNHLAVRYEPHFKWTFDIKAYASLLGATEDTIENMQKTSWGLCQVMGTRFFELGGTLEHMQAYRWPTSMLTKRIGLEYGCRAWKQCAQYYITPEEVYAMYNAGSIRYDPKQPENYINQKAVDLYAANLKEITRLVRY